MRLMAGPYQPALKKPLGYVNTGKSGILLWEKELWAEMVQNGGSDFLNTHSPFWPGRRLFPRCYLVAAPISAGDPRYAPLPG